MFYMFLDNLLVRMKGLIIGLVVSVLIVVGIFIYQYNFNFTTLQVLEYDVKYEQESVVNKFFVGEGDVIKLDKYDGNEITIMKVSSNGVVISRRIAISEFTPAPEGMYGGTHSTHYENVEEYIAFDDVFSINKDVEAKEEGLPALEQARFSYSLKFVKN